MRPLYVSIYSRQGCGACSRQLEQVVQQLDGLELVAWPPVGRVDLLFLAGQLHQLTAGDVCAFSRHAGQAVALGRCAGLSLPRDLHLPRVAGCAPREEELISALVDLFGGAGDETEW